MPPLDPILQRQPHIPWIPQLLAKHTRRVRRTAAKIQATAQYCEPIILTN
jgi:hypothetical protein